MLAFNRVENRQRHLEETSCLAASEPMPANSTGSLALSWPLRAALSLSRPAGRLKDSLLLVRGLTTTLFTYNNVGNITEIAVTPHRSRGGCGWSLDLTRRDDDSTGRVSSRAV